MHACLEHSFTVQMWQQYLRTGTLWQLQHQPLLSCLHQLMEKITINKEARRRSISGNWYCWCTYVVRQIACMHLCQPPHG